MYHMQGLGFRSYAPLNGQVVVQAPAVVIGAVTTGNVTEHKVQDVGVLGNLCVYGWGVVGDKTDIRFDTIAGSLNTKSRIWVLGNLSVEREGSRQSRLHVNCRKELR